MSKKLTKEEFVEKSEAIHGKGRYNYSKSVYKSALSKILIHCNVCGNDFW